MVAPHEAMESVALAIAESGELPGEMSVLLHESDLESEDADVDLPLLEIQLQNVDDVIVDNTDFAGYVVDDDGNHVGRIFQSEYEMTLQLDIWTTTDDGYDPDELGRKLRDALYPYSSYGPQQDFINSEGSVVDTITYFRLDSGGRVDDLLRTPSVRKWSQEVELWGCEEFRTDEEYIVAVDYPAPGEFNDSDDDLVIEDT